MKHELYMKCCSFMIDEYLKKGFITYYLLVIELICVKICWAKSGLGDILTPKYWYMVRFLIMNENIDKNQYWNVAWLVLLSWKVWHLLLSHSLLSIDHRNCRFRNYMLFILSQLPFTKYLWLSFWWMKN
jgi:hypothetical protein